MTDPVPPRRRSRVSAWVRRGSRLFLGVAALLGISLACLRWVALPGFIKAGLEGALREQGIQVVFGPIRLRGWQLTAEGIRFSSARPPFNPQVLLQTARLEINPKALLKGKIQPRSLRVEGGQFTWSTAPSPASRPGTIQDLTVDLSFSPDEPVNVAHLTGQWLNVSVNGTLSLTNASALRHWSWPAPSKKAHPNWAARLREWLDRLDTLQMAEGSSLSLRASADGRDPGSLCLDLQLKSARAAWRDGFAREIDLQATTSPALDLAGASDCRLNVVVREADFQGTHWHDAHLASRLTGWLTNAAGAQLVSQLKISSLRAHSATGQTITLSATTRLGKAGNAFTRFGLRADGMETPWGQVHGPELAVAIDHGWSPDDTWQAQWSCAAGPVVSPWGRVSHVGLTGEVSPAFGLARWRLPDPSWGFWAHLEPLRLDWNLELERIQSSRLELDSLSLAGEWTAPDLVLRNIKAALYGGSLQASADLDIVQRDFRSLGSMDFDAHQVSSLLTRNSQRWLSQFGWKTPPKVSAEVQLRLPVWDSAQPAWGAEVMPSVRLAGQFAGSDGTFRGVPVASAQSHFFLTNLVWHLPDLVVKRPDGEATLEYQGHMGTHEYQWQVDALLNPQALKPLLPSPAALRVVDQFDFSSPVKALGTVSGRWHEPESVRFQGHVAASNFRFRDEICHDFRAELSLRDTQLHFRNVRLQPENSVITVPTGHYDLKARVVYVTNAVSTADPDLVTRVIGPKVRAAIRPYHFGKPPTVRVNGRLPTVDIRDADVRFDVVGESFTYWKLHAPTALGEVHWRGTDLSISNLQASFYGGALSWEGHFDFSAPPGAKLNFQGKVREVDLNSLMTDLSGKANNLQGSLDADVSILQAYSTDWGRWNGFGEVRMRDGYLWDIPVFGFLSPVLNKVAPGLGNSPVSAGDASFQIVHSVVKTGNLELRSPAMRLQYTGSVDFAGNVDARMQAEIFRDAWGVGRVLSAALWPISKAFEYELSGTVDNPRTELVYIPRVVTWALHPIKTLKRIFGRGQRNPSANPFAASPP